MRTNKEINDRTTFWTWAMWDKYEKAGMPPRTHKNMRQVFGVARPGKTAQDKARRNKGGK
jgi:hypothetical protein